MVAPRPSSSAQVPARTMKASVPSSITSDTQPIFFTASSPISSIFAVILGANRLPTLITRLTFDPKGTSRALRAPISISPHPPIGWSCSSGSVTYGSLGSATKGSSSSSSLGGVLSSKPSSYFDSYSCSRPRASRRACSTRRVSRTSSSALIFCIASLNRACCVGFSLADSVFMCVASRSSSCSDMSSSCSSRCISTSLPPPNLRIRSCRISVWRRTPFVNITLWYTALGSPVTESNDWVSFNLILASSSSSE